MPRIPLNCVPLLDGEHDEIRERAVFLGVNCRVLIGEYWGLFTREEGLKLPLAKLVSVIDSATHMRLTTGRSWPAIREQLRAKGKIPSPKTRIPAVSLQLPTKGSKFGKAKKTKRIHSRKYIEIPPEVGFSENDVFAHGVRMHGSFQSRL